MTASRTQIFSPYRDVNTPAEALPVYFGTSGRMLFGWYHRAANPLCAVVICSPLGNEATGWHRASRHWAQRLADANIAALRFDYDGAGDSLGDMTDPCRLHAWVDSVCDAASFLRTTSHAGQLIIAGLHFGGTLALAAARSSMLADGLILWAPLATGRAFLREGRALTRLMATPMMTHAEARARVEQFGGVALNSDTVRELETFDPLATEPRLKMPILLVPRENSSTDATLYERLTAAGARVEHRAIAGYNAVITDAHQCEIPHAVIQESIDWIQKHVARTYDHRVTPAAETPKDRRTSHTRIDDTSCNGIAERAIRIGEHSLFGVVSQPRPTTRRETGILLVNAGSVYRVGPNRLHVTLARGWANLGYTVLRMDLAGLGDSATCAEAQENHPYPAHAVRDVEAAVTALREEGVKHIVVGGLCSGAHTAFHAALELDGIDGIILVNPIVFYWKPTDPIDIDAWRIYVESRHYKQSALRWSSWRKLATGRVSLPYVGGIIWQRMAAVGRAKLTAVQRQLGLWGQATESAPRDLARIASRGTEVMLMFSEGDPGHDYLTLNYERDLMRLARHPKFRLRVVRDADHTFTALDARRRLSGMLTDHLLACHP